MSDRTEHSPTVSNEAVERATGRGWEQWFGILDEAGALTLGHREIVALLDGYDIPGWWEQMITVEYEKARGLREKHQTPDGYAVSRSRTVGVRVDMLFQAFSEVQQRRKWLDVELTIRKATPHKSLRISWHDGTHLDVNLTSKGRDRAQVKVQHRKLVSRNQAEAMKAFWTDALDRLKRQMESA